MKSKRKHPRKRAPIIFAIQPLAYSIADAAKAVGLRRTALMEACKLGDLAIYKSPHTSTIRILRKDLEQLFEQQWSRYYG